jgi:hypothetical protein
MPWQLKEAQNFLSDEAGAQNAPARAFLHA